MAGGRMRSTRRLRSWIVEQVSSGRFPGLMWDDEDKTMFRIPWKHAGKQDFRKDEDAAIFKAWAEFKGKPTGVEENAAAWKTRLRCALNKSPEFTEEMGRAQLDISEPYKVYRLVPLSEQGVIVPEKKCAQTPKKRKGRKSSESSGDDITPAKQIKTEEVTSQLNVDDDILRSAVTSIVQTEEPTHTTTTIVQREDVDIMVDVRLEESVSETTGTEDSFGVVVYYLGSEVLRRHIQASDLRIQYLPQSAAPPPTPAVMKDRFPRVTLPPPGPLLPPGEQLQALSTLLPFMERGVALTSMPSGVYADRFCQGRVFWTGPHTPHLNTTRGGGGGEGDEETTPNASLSSRSPQQAGELRKMERNTSVLLFSKEAFKQQLDHFRSNGGAPPECSFTLCFGEELSSTEDPASKLIIVQITLPWAVEQVQSVQSCPLYSLFQSLANQGEEITLELVAVPTTTTTTTTTILPVMSPEEISCSV